MDLSSNCSGCWIALLLDGLFFRINNGLVSIQIKQNKTLTKSLFCSHNRNMETHATKIYFDMDIWEWLKIEARRLRCSVSELVRRLALAEMIRQRDEK